MKKYYLNFIIIMTISTTIVGQNIWKIDPISEGDFQQVSNLSIDSLQSIIMQDKWDSDPILYREAAEYLLIYYGDMQTQFLINNLNNVIDTTRTDMFSLLQWDKYYIDIYIKGILGDPTAVSRMDSIAQLCPKSNIKVTAIRKLAEAGFYDYWDYVNNNKEDIDTKVVYLIYGEDQRYKTDVLNYLENQIQNINPNDWLTIITIADNIGDLNPNREIGIINDYFMSTAGQTRKYYFDRLNIIDQANQPARSMWVIPREQNEFLRSSYIPIMLEERTFLESEGYFTPNWIHFMKERLSNEPSSLIKGHIIMNLIDFKPIKFDSISTLENNIDYVINQADTLYNYSWLGDLNFSNELKNILTTAKTNLQNGDSLACRSEVKSFQDSVDFVYKDSLNADPRFVTIEGWKFLYWNAQYILDRLPELSANPNLLVNLKNSLGNQIPASNVMYYEGSWKDAVNNGDGTFTVITTKPTVSIRMFYEYANQTVHNMPAQNNTYTFTTVNTAVELRNSSDSLMDAGTVQYYAGAWRSFGTTVNGVANKELLPINYSFRMTYEYVSLDKQQDINTNSTVTFSTVLCTVKVTKANGQPLSGASTKYYSGAWRDIGLTNANGEAIKELLPKSLNFRATSGNVSQDKQQDIGVNNLVEIQLNVP